MEDKKPTIKDAVEKFKIPQHKLTEFESLIESNLSDAEILNRRSMLLFLQEWAKNLDEEIQKLLDEQTPLQ